jgi:hypothetical protein
VTAGVIFKNALNPIYSLGYKQVNTIRIKVAHLSDYLPNFTEVCATTKTTARKEVFYEAGTNVIAHLLELVVHFGVVLVVLNELNNQCSVCERKQLGIL